MCKLFKILGVLIDIIRQKSRIKVLLYHAVYKILKSVGEKRPEQKLRTIKKWFRKHALTTIQSMG